MTNEMLAAANLLADALQRENEALARFDVTQAGVLLMEKTDAVSRFTAATRMAEGGPLLSGPTTVQAAHRLRNLADENRRLLDHAIKVQSRVINIIRQAALRPGVDRRYQAGGRSAQTRSQPMTLLADI